MAADWPQFRGPNASGVAADADEFDYPQALSLETLLWKAPLDPGISSPCVIQDRVFLTAFRDGRLHTLALEKTSGRLLWERDLVPERIEEVHTIGSPATPTPSSDGERVYVFFGSHGLLAYRWDGAPLWDVPLGPFKNNYGQASSPVIHGESVFLNCDQDEGSFLLAVDRRTGKEQWRTARDGFPRGFSTPILREAPGGAQLLVAGTLRLIAYESETGREAWSVDGLARIVNPSPILADGVLYVASYAPGGDSNDRISMEPFDDYLRRADRDGDGRIRFDEVEDGPFKSRFPQLDANKDGGVVRAEWESMRQIFATARNSIFALQLGEERRPPSSTPLWTYDRATPYVPSPVLVDGLVYMVKDGAILTCMNAATGAVTKQARLPATGSYYASPVAAGKLVYTVSRDGNACVLRSAPEWEVLSTASLDEVCMATPALSGGRVYLRSEKALYCFGARRR